MGFDSQHLIVFINLGFKSNFGRVALRRDKHVLFAFKNHLNRPFDFDDSSRELAGDCRRKFFFSAKGASHRGLNDADFIFGITQGINDGVFNVVRTLHRTDQSDFTAFFKISQHALRFDVGLLLITGIKSFYNRPLRRFCGLAVITLRKGLVDDAVDKVKNRRLFFIVDLNGGDDFIDDALVGTDHEENRLTDIVDAIDGKNGPVGQNHFDIVFFDDIAVVDDVIATGKGWHANRANISFGDCRTDCLGIQNVVKGDVRDIDGLTRTFFFVVDFRC